MENFKSSRISYKNIMDYVFKITLKSPKIYVSSFLIPIFATLLIYALKTSFGAQNYTDEIGQILNLLIIPFTFSSFTYAILIMNWEGSVLIKQSKVFSISIFKIYVSIFIITTLSTFASSILCVASINFFDIFLSVKNANVMFKSTLDLFFYYKTFGEAMSFIFSMIFAFIIFILYSLCVFLMSYIFCKLFKSLIVVQSINFILMIVFLVLGDCALDINLITNVTTNKILNTIGYLLPIKSFQWAILVLMTNSNMYTNNILQIIVNPKLEIPFTFYTGKINIILPITLTVSTLWITVFGTASLMLCKREIK